MIAYTPEQSQAIWDSVDFVNIMTYDLINRRDNETNHHTGVQGSLATVEKYLDLGLCASKINLGFAFYAKYFSTVPGVDCTNEPVGCPVVSPETADGSDAGNSGFVTFDVSLTVPTNLTTSTDGTCGANTFYTCSEFTVDNCCSSYGYCGSGDAHCGTGCQVDYGHCDPIGPSATDSYYNAWKYGQTDEEAGGQWYWDRDTNVFWTFDTVALIHRKFEELVQARGLGGVFAWSLCEDSHDWSHLTALAEGVNKYSK